MSNDEMKAVTRLLCCVMVGAGIAFVAIAYILRYIFGVADDMDKRMFIVIRCFGMFFAALGVVGYVLVRFQ